MKKLTVTLNTLLLRTSLPVLAVIILTCFSTISFAQENFLFFNTPESGNQPHTACKSIELNPGYYYLAAGNTSMSSVIDGNMVCDVDYLGSGYSGISPGSLNTSLVVGTTPGTFDISSTGSATYSVPLNFPPGTGGMTPNLTVSYNSQASNGLMGIGWGLSGFGLSAITRASQTLYHDDNISPISLSNNDRFLLDGSRLIVTSGNNGDNAAIYHSEAESFARIQSFGQTGSGPAYFIVETKDGMKFEYGNTSNSYIEAKGSATALIWLLNKVIDINGNYMKIYYHEDNNTGEYRPDYIEYTGNDVAGINNPYNQIKFVYGTRIDKQLIYVSGYPIKQSFLLTGIRIFAEGNVVRQYEFNYAFDADLGSHLSEVVEKGSDAKLFNPIKIGWTISANTNIPDPNSVDGSGARNLGYFADVNYANIKYTGDFNGDGFTDYFIVHAMTQWNDGRDWALYLNNDGLQFYNATPASTGTLPDGYQHTLLGWGDENHRIAVVDVNGDGMEDIVFPAIYSNHDEFVAMRSNGSGFESTLLGFHPAASTHANMPNGDPDPDNGHFQLLGDFDGDGTTDIFVYYFNKDKWYIHSWKHNSTYTCDPNTLDWGDETLRFFVVDFNGDGKDEIMFTFENPWQQQYGLTDYSYVLGLNLQTYNLEVVSFSEFPNSCEGEDRNIFTGDFNGDGATDLLTYHDCDCPMCGGSWRIGYAVRTTEANYPYRYDNFSASFLPNYGPPQSIDKEYYVADFNGDGKSDIAVVFHDGLYHHYVRVFYSIGNNVFHQAPDVDILNGQSHTWTSSSTGTFIGDFNGDAHADIMHNSLLGSEQFGIYFHCSGTDGFPYINDDYNKVTSITNGLNQTIFIDYNSLPELARKQFTDDFYNKGSDADFPVMDLQKPLSVLSKVTRDNGNGTQSIMKYGYDEARVHLHGKGFLGFSAITATNTNTSWKTINQYDIINTDPYYSYNSICYSYLSNSITKKGSTSTSETIFTNDHITNPSNSKIYFSFTPSTEEHDYLKGTSKISDFIYNNDGNPTDIVETYKNGNTVEVTSTTNNIFNTVTTIGTFDIKKITHSTKTQIYTSDVSNPYTRMVDYVYNPTTSNLEQEITDQFTPGQINTVYSNFTNTGSPQTVTISAPNATPFSLPSKISLYEYDNKFRFVTKTTNPIGDFSTKTYNANGTINSETDISNLTTTYKYDGFGRTTEVTTPQGHIFKTTFGWSGGSWYELYFKNTSALGNPDIKIFYDVLGREVRTESIGFSGTVNTLKLYNNMGKLHLTSKPYFGSTPQNVINYLYNDNYDRLSSVMDDGRITNITYNGLEITSSDLVMSTVKTYNSTGDLLTAVENGNQTVEYTYLSNGHPGSVSAAGSTFSFEYDNFGMQKKLTDPNAGIIEYRYNAYGELEWQKDNRNFEYTSHYDPLGRIYEKIGSQEGTYNYTYYSGGNGKEQLHSVTSPAPNSTSQSYEYDQYGRVTKFIDALPGKNMETSYEYDNFGNIAKQTYPSGFSITNSYDSHGYLQDIYHSSNNIWHLTSKTSLGQPLNYTLGSGSGQLTTQFTYDNNQSLWKTITSNTSATIQDAEYEYDYYRDRLNIRRNHINNFAETFNTPYNYDNLNRLTGYSSNFGQSVSVIYDDNGNILSKTDAGTLYTYGGSGAGPHAVTRIDNNPNTIPGVTQDLTYTTFGKIEHISENGKTLDFTYGPDWQRIKTIFNNGTATKTKYFTVDYEEEEVTGAPTRKLHYISGAHGLVAVYIIDGSNPGQMYYVLKDNLGSIIGLVDAATGNLEEYSYDPWGRRRSPVTGACFTSGFNPGYIIDRGYTGHEHLDEFGLINMNGRLYDPVLGRMLSPDNFVGAPGFSQAFNRYSYANNNPVKYIDPDGNNPVFFAVLAFAAAANVAMHYGDINNFWDGLGYAAIGAAAGAAGYGVGFAAVGATGLAGGFGAGFIGGAAGGMAGGFVSGTGNALMGGASFNNALEAGLMGGGMGGITGGISGGIAGGIDASIRGRNFWTGELPYYEARLDNYEWVPQSDDFNCKNATLESIEKLNGGYRDQAYFKKLGDEFLLENKYASLEEYFEHFGFDIRDPAGWDYKGFGGSLNRGNPIVIQENIAKGQTHTLTVTKIRQWTPNSSVKVWFSDPARGGIWKGSWSSNIYNSNFNKGNFLFYINH